MFIAGFIALSFLAVSSAHPVKTKEVTFNKLPVASCDKSLGVLCVPDACKKTSCSAVKDAICIADRCGCEARWFQFDEKKHLYQDVTATCGSFKAITDFAKFLDTQQDEDAVVTISPNELLTIFRKFNSLTSEALEYVASHMKKYAQENPTKEGLQRYEAATALLKSLDRSKKVLDEAVTERSFLTKAVGLAKKYGPTALKVGKAVYGALQSDEQNPDDVLLMDEDTGEMINAKINWKGIGKGVAQFGKGLWKGVTSDEMADEDKETLEDVSPRLSGCVGYGKFSACAGKDEDIPLNSEILDETADSDLSPRLSGCVGYGKFRVCAQSDEDVPLNSDVVARGLSGIKIATSALSDGGPFSDVLADPEARVNWFNVGKVAGKIGKKVAGIFL